MRILVTGGAGYIGSHTVRLFLARGHDVSVFDNLSAGHRAGRAGGAARRRRPARRRPPRPRCSSINRIEAVVHFAALRLRRRVGHATRPSTTRTTSSTRSTCSMRCRRNGVGKFVFSSTCATYGVPTAVPITEDEQQLPINPYGNTQARRRAGPGRLRRGLPVRVLRAALLQRRRRGAGRHHRRGPRPGDAPDPARAPSRARASGRTSRSSAPTTRRPTAPASATTSTSTTWPTRTSWRWRRSSRESAGVQPRHRPRLQRPRSHRHRSKR